MEEEKKELEVQEELEEQKPVEEAPVEEKAPEAEQQENVETVLPGGQPIEKLEDERPYQEIIESARLDFVKVYNKSRRVSYILMAVVMFVAIGSVILITRPEFYFKVIGWSLIGATIIGMLVFYIITKNKLPAQTQDYIKLINKTLNAHNYTDQKVTEPTTDEKEKLELAELIVDGVYKDLGNIASRNVIHGKYNEKTFVTADLGLYNNQQGRKRLSVFVGKYVFMPNSLHFTDHFIVNIKKGENPVDLPTDIENLAVLLEEENFTIYGPKDADYKKVFGSKLIPALKKIELDDTLLNVNFVFWAGHSTAYLSYTDDIMTLPFQNPFSSTANDKFRKDLYDVLAAFDSINK